MNGYNSPILRNSRIYYLWCDSSQENNYCNWHPTNQFLSLTIEIFGRLHKQANVFYMIMPMSFGAWKGQRVLFFCLGCFYLSKQFNHITKDENIFHLKSSSSNRPSYFPTFSPSKHTHITKTTYIDSRLLTWKDFDI